MNRYPIFFEETFLNEGYFQAIPTDKGNWYQGKLYGTICGITARDYFKEFSIAYELYKSKKLELLKDYCMKFYHKKGFWLDGMNDIADSSLAFKMFDFGVNAGTKTAVKLLQKTLVQHYKSNIKTHGQLDSETIKETNRCFYLPPKDSSLIEFIEGESLLYSTYVHVLKHWYKKRETFWKFGKTWLRRLKGIKDANDKIELIINSKPPEKIKINPAGLIK